MLFKRNDKIAIVVKPKTHEGLTNEKDYFTRYGEMRKDSKFLVSKNIITFWDTQKDNFNDQFACDVIGTSYCRSRAIACTKEEFQEMNKFIIMKSDLVKYHQEWQRGIKEDMKDIVGALKSYRYLDEGIQLANDTFESLSIDNRLEESQIIRTNSTGLTLYNPENVASRIAERRKAKLTREEKIALFKEQQSSVMN